MLKSEDTTTTYWGYDNILFKTYFEIAHTGNLSLLIINGSGSEQELEEVWEEIVRKDDEVKGNNQYNKIFKNYLAYAKLQHQKVYVQTCLFKIYLERDEEVIKELKKMGYIIDDNRYYESIQEALKKSGHLTTKIISKGKEIDSLAPKKQSSAMSFDQALAQLSVSLAPVIIQDNITLARFNEYYKIAKSKNKTPERGRIRRQR